MQIYIPSGNPDSLSPVRMHKKVSLVFFLLLLLPFRFFVIFKEFMVNRFQAEKERQKNVQQRIDRGIVNFVAHKKQNYLWR
jgi:hypothetical protein